MTGKIGFIGGGMMASAIVAGLTERMGCDSDAIFVSDLSEERCAFLRDTYHVHASVGADSFISDVDTLVLAVKPQAVQAAMREVAPKTPEKTVVASIVAGLTLASLEAHFTKQPIVRVMPNTPLSVGAGMSAYALNEKAERADVHIVEEILSACGRAVKVQESMMNAVTGLSGSGPAYGFLMIDALSDGGVMAGLPRETATLLAAQTLLGAAQMVLATGKHPDVLRDQVTSPAGTTIAGVRVMEDKGVRGALIDAVLAATKRSEELGKAK